MLSDDQVRRFPDRGYVFIPGHFAETEIDMLVAEVPAVFAEHRPETVSQDSANAASNPMGRLQRPESIVHRDLTPVVCRPVDGLWTAGRMRPGEGGKL